MKKQAKIPRGFPMNLRLSRTLSAIAQQSGRPGATMPPLMRGEFSTPHRWEQGVPASSMVEQATAQGTLNQFVAAKRHPTNLRTQFPPQLATNQDAKVYDQPNAADPAAGENMREGYAPKTGSDKAAADPHLALQKGMNVTRAMMWKHMAPTDRASHLLRQYYSHAAEAAQKPKSGNKPSRAR